MLREFEIYFSDLNKDAQRRLLEFVGEDDPKEMNWDIDMCPIGIYSIEDEVILEALRKSTKSENAKN